MNIFSRLFKKGKKENDYDVAKRVQDTYARSVGKLPPPNLGVSFECECGQWLQSNLDNFNPMGGKQIMCAHCGAVTFLPPEILDHTVAGAKTANLILDWQKLIKSVRHGRKIEK